MRETSCFSSKLISVIVPIYKIERYIGYCIESIINQTYKDLEIILVDDGSPDKCPEICDLYAQKDSRIKVIHKENGGLVSARKAGLRAATGDYVGYVDGDDWIEADFYEALCSAMRETASDIVAAGQSRDLFDKSVHLLNNLPIGVYVGQELDKLYGCMISYGDFYKPGITTYVWNKLFKREILLPHQMILDERITIGEDAAVVYPLLMSCERVCITDNCGYHYRQREDSMLKQSASFQEDARGLAIVYDYLSGFAAAQPEKYALQKQINDFMLSICIMRSGGVITDVQQAYLPYDGDFDDKDVVIYSAGTFGQQLVNRIRETAHCRVVGWVDDDYWEYRRCGLNVDAVESLANTAFDFVLIATVDSLLAQKIKSRLLAGGVAPGAVRMVHCPEEIREKLLHLYLEP